MWIHNDLIVACNRREKLFLVKLIYWTEHIVKRSFTAQCTDDFLHGPYKNQLVLDLNTKCGSELLYVRCELEKFATTIISIIFSSIPFSRAKKQNYFHHHIIYYFIMRHIKETSFLSQHIYAEHLQNINDYPHHKKFLDVVLKKIFVV